MKTCLLAFVLIAGLLTGCASHHSDELLPQNTPGIENSVQHQEPPGVILIKGYGQLDEMRKMSEAKETELRDYLTQTSLDMNGVSNREELKNFLDFICSLPFPNLNDMDFTDIMYYPDYGQLYISYEFDTGEIYSFNFLLNELLSGQRPETANGQKQAPIYTSKDGLIKVYPSEEDKVVDFNVIFFLMDIDGYLVRAGYRNDTKSVYDIPEDTVYKDLSCSSLSAIYGN